MVRPTRPGANDRPTPSPKRSFGEPWFAIAVFSWAFSMVAVPYTLIERGLVPPPNLASMTPMAPLPDLLVERVAELRLPPPVRAPAPRAEAALDREANEAPAPEEAAPVGPSADDLSAGESWSDLYALGHDLLRAQRLEDAVAALKGAAELNPDHAAIRYDLGYLLQLTGDADGAIREYRRTVALEPDHSFALYNLAYLLHRAGRVGEALPLYAQALELLPDNPYVAFNYAALLERQGQVERARSLFRRTAAIGGSSKIAGDARARLARLDG
ncbi:MAG: tetratricopeptide repeat protein [Geminicoccaceae bacterium]|nr:tetratricopeptide repeat protein [Geminicoccaceae bacterium]